MDIRLSEVISALSYALDVTEGQPMGHAVRSCAIGMRIGEEVGLDAAERSSLFYAPRRGTWFDPALVDALRSTRRDGEFWSALGGREPHRAIGAFEPADRVQHADGERLDRIAEAFALIIDAKSPYTGRHSEGVARIAVSIAGVGVDAPPPRADRADPRACRRLPRPRRHRGRAPRAARRRRLPPRPARRARYAREPCSAARGSLTISRCRLSALSANSRSTARQPRTTTSRRPSRLARRWTASTRPRPAESRKFSLRRSSTMLLGFCASNRRISSSNVYAREKSSSPLNATHTVSGAKLSMVIPSG